MEWSKDDYERLGDHVVSARIEAGLDRPALADKAGISTRTLADIENGELGKRKAFSVETLESIGRHVGWAPGSWRKILNGGSPELRSQTTGADPVGPEAFTDAQLLNELTRRQKLRDLEAAESFREAQRGEKAEPISNGLVVGEVQSGKTMNYLVILQRLLEERDRAGLPPLEHQRDVTVVLSRELHDSPTASAGEVGRDFDAAWDELLAEIEAAGGKTQHLRPAGAPTELVTSQGAPTAQAARAGMSRAEREAEAEAAMRHEMGDAAADDFDENPLQEGGSA